MRVLRYVLDENEFLSPHGIRSVSRAYAKTPYSLDLNGRTHSVTSGVKSVANEVFSPLRHAVVDVLSPIGDFFAGAVHYGSLQSENQKLQATIGSLRQEKAEIAFEKNQLRQLRQLMELKNLPSINARPGPEGVAHPG